MSPFTAAPPTSEALAAFARLEQPSRPRPLPGSHPAGAGRFSIELSVEETRNAFERDDAPLPEGSSIERAGSVLIVDAPFSKTALFFSTTSAGCIYSMHTEPTLEIEGFAPLGDLRAFAPVAIETEDLMSGEPKNMAMSEFWIDGRPWLLTAGRLDEGRRRRRGDQGAIVQISFSEAQRQEDDFRPPTWPAHFTFGEDAVSIVLDAPEGPIAVKARRTHGLCSFLVDLASPAVAE
jgi:hypothetical protein